MSWMDTLIVANLCKEVLWVIPYLLWQFDKIDGSEETWTKVIAFADITEWIILVLTRFVPYGTWGTIALGAFYAINLITLILQFVFAEWGLIEKLKTTFWIAFYVALMLIDIAHMDLIGMAAAAIGQNIQQLDMILKSSWFGAVLKGIILAVLKILPIMFKLKKKERRHHG